MSVRNIDIDLHGGEARVEVDGLIVPCRLRVTYKRDGSLSTLRIGEVGAPLRRHVTDVWHSYHPVHEMVWGADCEDCDWVHRESPNEDDVRSAAWSHGLHNLTPAHPASTDPHGTQPPTRKEKV